VSLGGKDLCVLGGTIRSKVDKDDAWFAALASSASAILDIGANVGYTALLANVYGRPDSVVLVDANADALGVALRNLAMNDMALNCRFHRAFVGSRDSEKVKFYTVGTGAAGSIYASHAKTASTVNSYFYIETITIDTLCTRLGLNPDLVKIDVEGAEHMVLEGAKQLAQKAGTIFFVEMHATEEVPMSENARKVLGWCDQVGYRPYYLKSHEVLAKPELIAHRGKCHLLLLPQAMTYPEYLRSIAEGSPLP
jgi:FkbM family methyltransferase